MKEDDYSKKEIMGRYRKYLSPDEKKIAIRMLEKLGIDPITLNDDLTGTKVRGFKLEDKKYGAESHIDVLRRILTIVLLKHSQDINKLLLIHGKKNEYFSYNAKDLRIPERLKGTDIYFETNESSKSLCVRCEKILKLFNMDYTSFEIEYYK